MKKSWQTKKLGDVAIVSAGNSAPQNEKLFNNGAVPFFRTKDAGRVKFGDINEADDYLNEEGAKGLRLFPPRTILFPKSGASTFLNHRVMLGVEGCVSSHLATIVADSAQVYPRFLLYFLSTVAAQDLVQDHSYPSLNLPTIENISVCLPPLLEQKRIVGVLDEVFTKLATAQANAEKNLQNARALFESQFHFTFSQQRDAWPEKRLGDIADFKNGLNFTKQSKGKTLRMVGVGDFQENTIVPLGNIQSVTINGEISDDYLIRPGDILTVRSNGSKALVGRCMLVPDVDGEVSYSGFVIRIRLRTNEVNPRFFLSFMKSSGTRYRLTRDGGGANISNINQDKLSKLSVPIPSLQQQEMIVDRLDTYSAETQRLEGIYAQKLAAIAELRRTVLHQAFSGQLSAAA